MPSGQHGEGFPGHFSFDWITGGAIWRAVGISRRKGFGKENINRTRIDVLVGLVGIPRPAHDLADRGHEPRKVDGFGQVSPESGLAALANILPHSEAGQRDGG